MHGGQVQLRVVLEDQLGAFGEPELAAALEVDGAREPLPGGHDHAAAAGLAAGGHRLGEGLRRGRHVAGFGAVLGDGEILRREDVHLQRSEFKRGLGGRDDGLRAGVKEPAGKQDGAEK